MVFVPAPVHLPPGVCFHLGEVACSTQPRIHPDYPTIYEDIAVWVAEFVPVPTEQAMCRLLEDNYTQWAASVYPKGIGERVAHTGRLTTIIFEVDDISLVKSAVFAKVAADCTASEHPYGRAFTDVFTSFERGMPPRVYQRFRAAWQEWYTATLQEVGYRKRRQIPDLDTYLPLRTSTVGIRPYLPVIEYVFDHDLTDLLDTDPDLTTAGEATARHVMLVNDLLSLRHEAFGGEWFNAVLIILHQGGGHLQQAVDAVRDLIADTDHTLTRLTTDLRARHHEPIVHAYLDNLHAICAGNLYWHRSTSRYLGHANPWNGRRTGTLTLHPDHTTIT